MKTNFLSTIIFTVFALFSNMVFGQLNRFQLLPSGETEDYMKYIRNAVTVDNVNYFTGYLTLSAFKNYNTNVMYDPGNPLQKLQLRGGNILLYGTYPYANINPTSKNGAILFSDNISAQYPHGKWGIEYDDQYSTGGLNIFMPKSSLTSSRSNFKLFIKNDGFVGIGTGTPSTRLHVVGDITVSNLLNNSTRDYIVSTDETGKLILTNVSTLRDNLGNHIATQNLILGSQTMRLSSGSEKVIGPDGRDWTPGLKFHNEQPGQLELGAVSEVSFNLNNYVSEFGTPLSCMYWTANSRCGGIGFGLNSNNKGCIMWDQNNPQSIMTFVGTKVGIGCDPGTSKHRLFVKDGIVAEEVLVKLQNQWSDYVFNADYDLMSLDKLSDFITKNQHLPDIPTAREVDDNGLNVGEMNALLLKKVEELTLYIIKQQEQLDKQQAEINQLKEK